MKFFNPFAYLVLACAVLGSCTQSIKGSRGIGVYPGDPQEYDGPVAAFAGNGYRNLALHRAVWHSVSADYNLTGHLATDGIISRQAPAVLSVDANGTAVENRLKERLFDDNFTGVTFPGKAGASLVAAMEQIADADVISFEGNCKLKQGASLPKGFIPTLTVVMADDGSAVELALQPCPGLRNRRRLPSR